MDPREEKLRAIIADGERSVKTALADITDEFQRRQDMMVKPSVIGYHVTPTAILPIIKDRPYSLTPHSESNLLHRASLPQQFIKKLQELGEFDLAQQNLRTMTDRLMSDGVLVRQIPSTKTIEMNRDNNGIYEVAGTIKGWLSPQYKRMDAAPVFQSYIKKSLDLGFVPYRGYNTDSRYHVSFLLPQTYEPIEGEFVAFGTSLITSDYGQGALELSMMILRIICKNLALGYDLFKRIHIGSRFQTDQDVIELSRKTIELDGQTVASAMGDVIDTSMKQIEFMKGKIAEAGTKEVNPKVIYESLRKKGVKKEITDQIKSSYESDLGVDFLPPVQSAWRMANTISLISQGIKDQDAKIDLEKMSMNLIAN